LRIARESEPGLKPHAYGAFSVTLMIKWHLFENCLASNALRVLLDIGRVDLAT
jgi:hypothetical protein